MFRLTAGYAEQWNAAWFGRPTNNPAQRAQLVAAFPAERREPATIAATAGMNVRHPEMLSATMRIALSERYLGLNIAHRRSAAELDTGLQALHELERIVLQKS